MTPARRAVPFLLLILTVLVQVSIVQRIEVGDASPDLVVLMIVSLALLSNSIWGAGYGFLAGLALGLFAALPLGPHALIGTIVGYWVGRWSEVLVTDEHPLPPVLAGVVGTMAMQAGRPLLEFLVSPAVTTTRGIWTEAAIVTVLNALLAIPVYVLTRRVLRAARSLDGLGGEVLADA